MSAGKPRHELKYYIRYADYHLLSTRLSLTLDQDKYAQKNGGEYFIRSLYFDDLADSAFREKLSGVDDRDKFRVRIYNMSDAAIKLERKHKDNGYIIKDSILLSRGEYDSLYIGEYGFLLNRPEPFAHVMYGEFATRQLQPRVIVDYMREAYTFPLEDVRITFDKDVRTAYRSTRLFSTTAPTYGALHGFDMVMEVKFNRYLPTYVRSLLQIPTHTRSAISKYCLCRKFEL